MAPTRPRLAVLVDADNIPVSAAARAFPAAARLGRVTHCSIYGFLPRKFRSCWHAAAAEVPGLPAPHLVHRAGRSAAEIALSMDAVAMRHEIDGVCILSCDADLAQAALRLRSDGLTVHVFGSPETAKALRSAASIFHLIPAGAEARPAPARHAEGAA